MATTGDDCYFYYNSTCLKGDKCPFRHCSAALGSSTVCTLWLQGCCFRAVCAFRHMHVNPSKSEVPCFFESQPTGCLKANCPFKHLKPRNVGTPKTSSVAAVSATQPTVGVVRPVVPDSPNNSVQAGHADTSQLTAVKEGHSSLRRLSATSASEGSPTVMGQEQKTTTTTPRPKTLDSFSFDLSKLTPSSTTPFAVQQLPACTQSSAVPSKEVNQEDNSDAGDKQELGTNGPKLKLTQSASLGSKEKILAARKKARAERFGVKSQVKQSDSSTCQPSILSVAAKPGTIQQDDRSQELQTGSSGKKIRLTAKVSPAAHSINVKSFDEIMREKRQKQLSVAQSTVEKGAAVTVNLVARKKRQSQGNETPTLSTSSPKKLKMQTARHTVEAVSSVSVSRLSVNQQNQEEKKQISAVVTGQCGDTTQATPSTATSSVNKKEEKKEINIGTNDVAAEQSTDSAQPASKSVDQREPAMKTSYTPARQRVLLRRVSSKARDDHESLLDAELEEMLGTLSGSDAEDNKDGSKDDDDLILDIEELVNS